jgi:chaperone required for assembly of F1-ATPase
MRDIFEDIFKYQPLDPTESARRSLRPSLRARFYKEAHVGEGPEGFPVLLDGRSVRTPARRLLSAPVRGLAEAMAAEWAAQSGVVDPAIMPLTRLANSIIDGVADAPRPVAAEIEQYLGTDLLFYRAPNRKGLPQRAHWDPVLAWAHETFCVRFALAEGAIYAAAGGGDAVVAASIPRGGNGVNDIWRLGALSVVTTLTGSALLALALAAGRISADEAWAAANVDEDWNISQWGSDALALERRAYRLAELQAAAAVLSLLRDASARPPAARASH